MTSLERAQTTADVLTSKWFGPNAPNQWSADDFWRVPNITGSLATLAARTQSSAYDQTILNARSEFLRAWSPPYSPGYYDDEGWWGVMFARLFELNNTVSPDWLSLAGQVFDDLNGGLDDVAGGGVWFKRSPKSYPGNEKNSIPTSLYIDLGLRLYESPISAQKHLDGPMKAWKWLDAAIIDDFGLVWGNVLADGNVNPNNPPRPYSQGVILGGLSRLYKTTRDGTLIDRAIAIADAGTRMAWPGTQILQELCEAFKSCNPSDSNSSLFKGVFVRYLGELAEFLATLDVPGAQDAASRYATILAANGDAVWNNFPGHIFGFDWHTSQPSYQPTGHTEYDATLQSSVLDLFLAVG